MACQEYNMTSVLERIDQQLMEFKRHKLWETFFHSVKGPDAALDTLKAFAPALSYFIMAFSDFNEFVLPYETPKNVLQISINNHAKEDRTHYKLFIEDWEKLGGDKLLSAYDHLIFDLPLIDHQASVTERFLTIKPESTLSSSTKMLSFLWSDASNRHNRVLMHSLIRLVHTYGEDPAVRFAIIESIEQTGCFAFSLTSAMAREITKSNGLELRYFGDYHLALETGHLVNQKQTFESSEVTKLDCECENDAVFKKLPLSELQYNQCIQVADCVVKIFIVYLDGVYNMMINRK